MSKQDYLIARIVKAAKPDSAALKYALDVAGSRNRAAEAALVRGMQRSAPPGAYTEASRGVLRAQKRKGSLVALQNARARGTGPYA